MENQNQEHHLRRMILDYKNADNSYDEKMGICREDNKPSSTPFDLQVVLKWKWYGENRGNIIYREKEVVYAP